MRAMRKRCLNIIVVLLLTVGPVTVGRPSSLVPQVLAANAEVFSGGEVSTMMDTTNSDSSSSKQVSPDRSQLLDVLRSLSLAQSRSYFLMITREIQQALAELNSLIDKEVVMWVASMYDPETGGFFYARSAIGQPGFSADIESTAQAYGLIRDWGFESTMPASVRQKLIHFFQSRQDPATGYFYDPQFGSNVTDAKRSRNLNQAVGALRNLGARPLYPLPYERASAQGSVGGAQSGQANGHGQGMVDMAQYYAANFPFRLGTGPGGVPLSTGSPGFGASDPQLTLGTQLAQNVSGGNSALPEYLRSPQALRRWMESFDWERNAYAAGHNVGSARNEIIQAGLVDTVYEFIESIQNPDTGLWGQGLTYNELSGAMKLSEFYSAEARRPYPNAKKMVESVLYVLEHDTPSQIFFIFNPPYLIDRAIIHGSVPYEPEIDELLQELVPKMIRMAKENLLRFRQPDGAYSYFPHGSAPRSQGALVSLGLRESDMNATSSGTNGTINLIYRLVGLMRPNLVREYAEEFWETILSIEAQGRAGTAFESTVPAGFSEDFEGYPIDSVPADWSVGGAAGEVRVVTDPHDPENQVLLVHKTASGPGTLFHVSKQFWLAGDSMQTTIRFRFMMEEPVHSDVISVGLNFGASASQADRALNFLTKKQGSQYFFAHRTVETGRSGTGGAGANIIEIEPNRWYDVEVIYEPRGVGDTRTTVYIDGEMVAVLDQYFNAGDETKPPVKDIRHLRIHPFLAFEGAFYLDDLSVTLGDRD